MKEAYHKGPVLVVVSLFQCLLAAGLQSFQISLLGYSQSRNATIDATGNMIVDPLNPDGTLFGMLYGSKPVNACSAVERPSTLASDSESLFRSEALILLAQRGECELNVKLSLAQSAGYTAMIIFDARGDLPDRAPVNLQSNNTTIPVFFVNYFDGRVLWRKQMHFGSYVLITPVNSSYDASLSGKGVPADLTNALLGFIPTVSYVCVVLFIVIIFIMKRVFHCSLFVLYKMVTGNNKVAASCKPKIANSTIQLMDNTTSCCICLESIKNDDQLLIILPCKHIFHQKCIDHWLRSGKLACPLCRRKITFRKIIQQVLWTHHIVSPLTSIKVTAPVPIPPAQWACSTSTESPRRAD